MLLEPLAVHPDLEVQERAVEFSELLKLAAEAASDKRHQEMAINRMHPYC
jgi:AP-3 complex subunit delta-1